jgi:hypothetical protein
MEKEVDESLFNTPASSLQMAFNRFNWALSLKYLP